MNYINLQSGRRTERQTNRLEIKEPVEKKEKGGNQKNDINSMSKKGTKLTQYSAVTDISQH